MTAGSDPVDQQVCAPDEQGTRQVGGEKVGGLAAACRGQPDVQIPEGELDLIEVGIESHVLAGRPDRVGVGVDPDGRPRAETLCRKREHAGPCPDIEHERAAKIDSLQRGEAESRGGVMSGPKAHGWLDDNAGPTFRSGGLEGVRTNGEGLVSRRKDGESADGDGLQVLLRAARPVFVIHVAGQSVRRGESRRKCLMCAVAIRCGGEEHGEGTVAIFDGHWREVIHDSQRKLAIDVG